MHSKNLYRIAAAKSLDELVNSLTEEEQLVREIDLLRYAVAKVGNIPWDVSISDIVEIVRPFAAIEKVHVHIPIDRMTGKTKGELYIELPGAVQALKIASTFNKKLLKGRTLNYCISSYQELYSAHFKLPFQRSKEFISEAKVISVVNICRNYKAHFSRKCAERPFEHVISCLRLAPWYLMEKKMCDRMFFMACGATDALVDHLTKINLVGANDGINQVLGPIGQIHKRHLVPLLDPTARPDGDTAIPSVTTASQLGPELLSRLVDATEMFPAFTSEQKNKIRGMAERNKPKFGSPMTLQVSPKLMHPRGKTGLYLDRILHSEPIKPGEMQEQCNHGEDSMKLAFQKIMLSIENNAPVISEKNFSPE